jgi:hypothetical protein
MSHFIGKSVDSFKVLDHSSALDINLGTVQVHLRETACEIIDRMQLTGQHFLMEGFADDNSVQFDFLTESHLFPCEI